MIFDPRKSACLAIVYIAPVIILFVGFLPNACGGICVPSALYGDQTSPSSVGQNPEGAKSVKCDASGELKPGATSVDWKNMIRRSGPRLSRPCQMGC